ncbi:MAG: hypothetical protein ACXWC7_10725 [Chitinophagaceae bacterium]
MRKWLTTYWFIVCGVCVHVCGFTSPAMKSQQSGQATGYTKSSKTFTFKKALLSSYAAPAEKNAGLFFHQHSIRVLSTVVSYYLAELNFFISVVCHIPGEAISTKKVERVLKDHLLHLFPSHYFW